MRMHGVLKNMPDKDPSWFGIYLMAVMGISLFNFISVCIVAFITYGLKYLIVT